MPWKGNAPMPPCNKAQQQEIIDAVARLRGAGRQAAEDLLDDMGAEELCRVLHAMRRWYSYNCWNAAKKILPHRKKLTAAMDLDPEDVVGVYRGIRVPQNHELAEVDPRDEVKLSMDRGGDRNGGCSSWTLQRKFANRFSGKQPGKVGLVVRIVDPLGSKPFIAPPSRSAPWFNTLYKATMGESFRFNEMEYALQGKWQLVEVVAVKR